MARLSPMESHSTGSIRVPDRVQVLSKPDVQGALCAAPVLLVAARLLACEEILTVSVPTSNNLFYWQNHATVVYGDLGHHSSLVCSSSAKISSEIEFWIFPPLAKYLARVEKSKITVSLDNFG